MCLHHFFLVLCYIILDCWLFWDGLWSGKFHHLFLGSRYPSIIFSLCLITMNLCLSKVNIHSSSYNCPIEMRLEWRLGDISSCFSWLHKLWSGIWDWWVDATIYELGTLTFIEFLIATWCVIWLLGNPDSVLWILSHLLGHLHVVSVVME